MSKCLKVEEVGVLLLDRVIGQQWSKVILDQKPKMKMSFSMNHRCEHDDTQRGRRLSRMPVHLWPSDLAA